MIQHLTLSIDATRFYGVACVSTRTTDAGHPRRTISVRMTNLVQLNASTRQVATRSCRARTFRLMVVHFTHFGRMTIIRLIAWILALCIYASLRAGTIGIGATTQQDATNQWITAQTRRTLTDRTMIDAIAFGPFTTLSTVRTRTNRFTFAIYARMCSRTFRIRVALNFDVTINLWIAIVTLFAGANRFVVFDATLCMSSTIARILAYIRNASFVCTTIRIQNASGNATDRLTGAAATADKSFGTHTVHGSHWFRWYHLTTGWPMTWFQCTAWIQTFLLNASQPIGTVQINLTIWHHIWLTINVRISNQTGRTSTNGHMHLGHTFGTR